MTGVPDRRANVSAKLQVRGWACPRIKWFNFIPYKFNTRKRNQLQKFIDIMEANGCQILEQCPTPFITALKIQESRG